MPTFEFIDSKHPNQLERGDHIIHQNAFWRVVENYRILGHAINRMLMVVPESYLEPKGFKFLEIKNECRIDAYIRTD